ncbi:MAG: MmcQ/YjbR family DNA-binding protein [Clostridia bacterium]|nr:MmcQ/YjbR family DNA-binding protein [Clostridia bacterium]
MFEEVLKGRCFDPGKLEKYGFVFEGGSGLLRVPIMDGAFTLEVIASDSGEIDTRVFDAFDGEEYQLYKTSAGGLFVGAVREAISAELEKIADACAKKSDFRFTQTHRLLGFLRKEGLCEPEDLFGDDPPTAVLRRADSRKWFGIIMTVARGKVDGSPSRDLCEVVNFRVPKEECPELLTRRGYYPAWHMNKKSWFSVILDGTVPDGELFDAAAKSFALAAPEIGRKKK